MMEFSRRKWGWYLTLIDRKYFKVKILRFRQHAFCSMQKHKLRDEMWLFLSGRGCLVQKEDGRQATHFPVMGDFIEVLRGHWHQFTAYRPTTVLEIQYGDKCDEGDIERA